MKFVAQPPHRWLIEGELVTRKEIGERIHVCTTAADARLAREQARPGPVTWAGLKLRHLEAKERDA